MINLNSVSEFSLTTVMQGLSSNHFYKLSAFLDDAIVIQKRIWGYASKEHQTVESKIIKTVMPLDHKYRKSLIEYSDNNSYYYSVASKILVQI